MALRLMGHLGRAKGQLQVVYDNEDFFVKHTIKMIDECVNGLTRYTDGAVYEDKTCFRDRFGHSVPWFDMSTGGKTVLNVFYNPDICFSQCECGENAWPHISPGIFIIVGFPTTKRIPFPTYET